jgi:hypothetical protein
MEALSGPPGRAVTDEQKTQLMARLLDAWKLQPKLRLGQLLYCAIGGDGEVLHDYEDFPLIDQVELWGKP